MPYRPTVGDARQPLKYWTHPTEAMVFACSRPEGTKGWERYVYSYVTYGGDVGFWGGGNTGHVGLQHNGGAVVGFVDAHAARLPLAEFMGTDQRRQRLWGHEH